MLRLRLVGLNNYLIIAYWFKICMPETKEYRKSYDHKNKGMNFLIDILFWSYCKKIWDVIGNGIHGCFIQIKEKISMIKLTKPMIFLKKDLIASQSINV